MSKNKCRVLLVDDDPNVLSGFKRALHGKFDLMTALGASEGLATLDEHGPFEVVVTDMRMPEMNGIEFVEAARVGNTQATFVMLTGNSDQHTAIEAINRGQVFRFLNKPCPVELLVSTIGVAKRQHDLVQAERILLQQTLAGSVRLLVEIISLSDPLLARVTMNVRREVQQMLNALGVHHWRILLASHLCVLGLTVVYKDKKTEVLCDAVLERSAKMGWNLLRYIPRLEEVAAIVGNQRETGPMPDLLDVTDVNACRVIGSRLLRFAIDLFSEMESGKDRPAALASMRASDVGYDPRLFAAAENTDHLAYLDSLERVSLPVDLIKPGMIVDTDILAEGVTPILYRGTTLSTVLIERLKGVIESGLIEDRFDVLIDPAVDVEGMGTLAA